MARATPEVWAMRVEPLVDSGSTAKEFAAEIGVNANTLTGWRWRLGRRRKETGSASPTSSRQTLHSSEARPDAEEEDTEHAEGHARANRL